MEKRLAKLNTTHELETTKQKLVSKRLDIVEQELGKLASWYKVPMLDAAGASSFPQTVSYASVLGPKNLPFRVQGEFRTNGALNGVAGIVYHVGNDDHEANAGFKIVLTTGFSGSTGYKLGFYVSQHTSFYSTAESEQTGLDDGNWHSFEAIATSTTIQLIVDGVEGLIKGPSDERGVQTVKEFGRVINTEDYVLGRDPCCTQHGEQRILSGQIRNVVLSWLPPSRTCINQDHQGSLCLLKVYNIQPSTHHVSFSHIADSSCYPEIRVFKD